MTAGDTIHLLIAVADGELVVAEAFRSEAARDQALVEMARQRWRDAYDVGDWVLDNPDGLQSSIGNDPDMALEFLAYDEPDLDVMRTETEVRT